MKNFQNIFNSYFHNKYQFEDFITTFPIVDTHITFNEFKNYSFYGYKKEKKILTKEAKELYDYHKFIEKIIIEYINVNQCVYSYSKNKSIYEAIFLHKDSKYFFKTDIQNFFSSIDSKLIEKTIKDNIDRIPVCDIETYLDNIIKLITVNDTLPVGFTTSPKLSNIILSLFDDEIEIYCKKNNIIYTRYSDDLIFSSNNHTLLENLKNIIKTKLKELYEDRFSLNDKKTIFLDKTKKISLLGMVITPQGHVTIDKNIKQNIKQLIYFYKNDKVKYQNHLEKYYDGSKSKAYGKLNYIYEIDKNFIIYLREKYGNYIIDQFLHGTK